MVEGVVGRVCHLRAQQVCADDGGGARSAGEAVHEHAATRGGRWRGGGGRGVGGFGGAGGGGVGVGGGGGGGVDEGGDVHVRVVLAGLVDKRGAVVKVGEERVRRLAR
eukprot:1965944-Pleurochrysis_carterae.AAC.1